VDDMIDRAHDALAAGETQEVDRALDEADALLRAHPELPQAAWLMAEVERARSARWRRLAPRDDEAAGRAWARALALGGARATGISEEPLAVRPQLASVTFNVAPDERLWIDGTLLPLNTTTSFEGPHTLVITLAAAPIWAGWIDLPPGTSVVEPPGGAPEPCSSIELRRVTLSSDSVHADGVRCGRWVAAAAGERVGELRLALCEGPTCGVPFTLQRFVPWTRPTMTSEPAARHWPQWASWALVGAGASIAAAVATGLVVSGAFQAAPSETRFVSGGLVRGP
jgi:hypothetical protein